MPLLRIEDKDRNSFLSQWPTNGVSSWESPAQKKEVLLNSLAE